MLVSRKQWFVATCFKNRWLSFFVLLFKQRKADQKKNKVFFCSRRPGAVQEERTGVCVFRNQVFVSFKKTRCCFLQPEEKPGFVYLFQEWFVSKKRRRPETRRRTRRRTRNQEPGTTLLVVSC